MAEYIKKEDALRQVLLVETRENMFRCIKNIPSADVVERKTGMWIGEGDGYADGNMVYDMWYCGACGTRFDEWEEEPDWKYCPVCGSYNGGDEDV